MRLRSWRNRWGGKRGEFKGRARRRNARLGLLHKRSEKVGKNLCFTLSRCSLVMGSKSSPVSVLFPCFSSHPGAYTSSLIGTSHPELAEIIARRYGRLQFSHTHTLLTFSPTVSGFPSQEPQSRNPALVNPTCALQSLFARMTSISSTLVAAK